MREVHIHVPRTVSCSGLGQRDRILACTRQKQAHALRESERTYDAGPLPV
jgi:hypothetical protein